MPLMNALGSQRKLYVTQGESAGKYFTESEFHKLASKWDSANAKKKPGEVFDEYTKSNPEVFVPQENAVMAAVRNFLPSAGRTVAGIGEAVAHLPTTLGSTAGLFLPNGIKYQSEDGSEKTLGGPAGRQALVQFAKNRYGSLDAAEHTFREDPVGLAGDVASVLSGVGGVARGASRVATIAKLPAAAEFAANVGKVAGVAADIVDPIVGPIKMVKELSAAKRAKIGKELYREQFNIPVNDAKALGPVVEMGWKERIPGAESGIRRIQGETKAMDAARDQAVADAHAAGYTVDPVGVVREQEPVYDAISGTGSISGKKTIYDSINEFVKEHIGGDYQLNPERGPVEPPSSGHGTANTPPTPAPLPANSALEVHEWNPNGGAGNVGEFEPLSGKGHPAMPLDEANKYRKSMNIAFDDILAKMRAGKTPSAAHKSAKQFLKSISEAIYGELNTHAAVSGSNPLEAWADKGVGNWKDLGRREAQQIDLQELIATRINSADNTKFWSEMQPYLLTSAASAPMALLKGELASLPVMVTILGGFRYAMKKNPKFANEIMFKLASNRSNPKMWHNVASELSAFERSTKEQEDGGAQSPIEQPAKPADTRSGSGSGSTVGKNPY